MKTILDIPIEDLDTIVDQSSGIFNSLNNGSLLLTGATGKIGKWLLASALHAIHELDLNLSLVIPSRNPQNFLDRYGPDCANASIRIVEADLGSYDFTDTTFTHILHAAVDNRKNLDENHVGLEMIKTTQMIARLCEEQNISRVLYLSSGAVYETDSCKSLLLESDVDLLDTGLLNTDLSDTDLLEKVPSRPAYGTAKKYSETLLMKVGAVIARGFSFVGPHFPLNTHFAIGNFISASLKKEPIIVRGDGRDIRSHMYGSDLASWLWSLLVNGQPRTAYNVGSDFGLSIGDLAQFVARVMENPAGVQILDEEKPSQRGCYVPDIQKARKLGLDLRVNLESAIDKTAKWATTHPDVA